MTSAERNNRPDLIAASIRITGLVQGVGFRPFVFRMATVHRIRGWVENGNDGVRIHAEGIKADLDGFMKSLRSEAPRAASIREIASEPLPPHGFSDFSIRQSSDRSSEITEISPDIAVCDDCLEDMKSQRHRQDYPFINCTNCGPRFTIIRDLPYDREKTTMEPFVMCRECRKEYTDVADRRFHAQPVACNHCGPHYTLIHGEEGLEGTEAIIGRAVELLQSGKILAIKGTGGFHLACDATNEQAVATLRQRKNREGKPFAVMFGSTATARLYLNISEEESRSLNSWQRPVVILENNTGGPALAPSVSNGFGTTGVMLPYMPFHHLLFGRLPMPAIVMTSGNISDEPVIIGDESALAGLAAVADAFLLYNREIHNRADDPVVMIVQEKTRMVRRSRGFTPAPVEVYQDVEGIFAAGAELVNCFCLGKGKQAILSQHIGDLKNLETFDFYSESFQRFSRMFRLETSLVAADLHPDYLSSRFAMQLCESKGIPLVRVQHHHAHIAACMAEHSLSDRVIGISMDGTGFGTDGHTWGFEVLSCDLSGFERLHHLAYVPQPGGDKVAHEPWRMAVAYLYKYAPEILDDPRLIINQQINPDTRKNVIIALQHGINTPLTSSAGRLFDAIAALTGICCFASFHAEAPMRLERAIDPADARSYDFNLDQDIDPGPMIRQIALDAVNGISAGIISARFHRTIINMIVRSAQSAREKTGIGTVVLSGGTFQNRFILGTSESALADRGFRVFTPSRIPANDGGIALGQLVIAANLRHAGKLHQR